MSASSSSSRCDSRCGGPSGSSGGCSSSDANGVAAVAAAVVGSWLAAARAGPAQEFSSSMWTVQAAVAVFGLLHLELEATFDTASRWDV